MSKTRIALTFSSAILAAGCTPKVSWTEEKVLEELTQIEENVPLCHTIPRDLASTDSSRRRVDGACGGSVTGSSEHENGVTDYEVLLSAFCLETTEGQLTVEGTLLSKEVGTPSDNGPIIDRLEWGTDGPMVFDHEGEITEVEMSDGLVEYGVPEAWAPGVPTADAPDLLSVRELSLTFPDGSTTFVADIQATRVGSAPLELTVTEGQFGVRGDYSSDLRTPEGEPLVFDLTYFNFGGSGAELLGRGDSVLTIVPEPLAPGRFDLLLDGEPFSTSLDCTEAVTPIWYLAAALYAEVPIY